MPSDFFYPGDTCFVRAEICNLDSFPLSGFPVFIILDIHGSYYFAPGFSQELDYYLDEIPVINPGMTPITVIEPFIWPEHGGRYSGVQWIGAITDPDLTYIIGDLSVFSFGWNE